MTITDSLLDINMNGVIKTDTSAEHKIMRRVRQLWIIYSNPNIGYRTAVTANRRVTSHRQLDSNHLKLLLETFCGNLYLSWKKPLSHVSTIPTIGSLKRGWLFLNLSQSLVLCLLWLEFPKSGYLVWHINYIHIICYILVNILTLIEWKFTVKDFKQSLCQITSRICHYK